MKKELLKIISPEEAFKAIGDLPDFKVNEAALKNGYIGEMAVDENGDPIFEIYTSKKII